MEAHFATKRLNAQKARFDYVVASLTPDGTFMKELFLQKLPTNVRMVLASSSATTSLEELAELADKIAEVAAPAVAAIQQTPAITEELAHLKTELAKLQNAIRSLSRSGSHTPRRNRTPSRHRSNSPTPNTHTNSSDEGLVCWYHRKFGSEARKCNPPCSHSPNEQASH